MEQVVLPNSKHSICPELLSQSDDIEVTYANLRHSVAHGKLPLFDTRWLSNNAGGMVFVGGPVASMEFHSSAEGICAVGAHRADQPTHEILKCYKGLAHIQLWRFTFEYSQCLALIPHNGNCTWDMKWKPERLLDNSDTPGSGILAAALGDGTVMVYSIDSTELDVSAHMNDDVAKLSPNSVHLRANKRFSTRSPVRVLEWSRDGNLLVVGAADGSIEVYNSRSAENTWPKWSIPGHESVIMDMRWLSDFHLCSLGLSCVLRLRDIREPVALLEQNMEGLSGSMSMDTLEPNVAVIGGDYGYLRVVRLSGADGVLTRLPVRRVRLQTSSFRAMRSIPVAGRKSSSSRQTLLYTGGPEGMLHELRVPRPLWTSPEVCHIGRTKISERLRWVVKRAGGGGQEELSSAKITLSLQLSKETTPMASETEAAENESGDLGNEQTPTASGRSLPELPGKQEALGEERQEKGAASKLAKKKATRKSRAVGKDLKDLDYSFFGESYNQKIVISRIAICERGDMIAIGIDGGIITWFRLNLKAHDAVAREEEACEQRKSTEKKVAQSKAGAREEKVIKPPRKRGRPRKYPLTFDKEISNLVTDRDQAKGASKTKGETANGAKEDTTNSPNEDTTNGAKEEGTNSMVDVQIAEGKEKKKGRPKAAPLIGPKRKRGRPRKHPLPSDGTGAQGRLAKKRKAKDELCDPPNDGSVTSQAEAQNNGVDKAERTEMTDTAAVAAATATTAALPPVDLNVESVRATNVGAHADMEVEATDSYGGVDSTRLGIADVAVRQDENNMDASQEASKSTRAMNDRTKRSGGARGKISDTQAKPRSGRKQKTAIVVDEGGRKSGRGKGLNGPGVTLERSGDVQKSEKVEKRAKSKAARLATRGAADGSAGSVGKMMVLSAANSREKGEKKQAEKGAQGSERAESGVVTVTERVNNQRGGDLREKGSEVGTDVGKKMELRSGRSSDKAVLCRLRRKWGVVLKLRVRAPGEVGVDSIEVGVETQGREEGKKVAEKGREDGRNRNGGAGEGNVKLRLRIREGRVRKEKKIKELDKIMLKLRVREERANGKEPETWEESGPAESNEGMEITGRSKRRRKPSWKVADVEK